jgi:hypothetical protein
MADVQERLLGRVVAKGVHRVCGWEISTRDQGTGFFWKRVERCYHGVDWRQCLKDLVYNKVDERNARVPEGTKEKDGSHYSWERSGTLSIGHYGTRSLMMPLLGGSCLQVTEVRK